MVSRETKSKSTPPVLVITHQRSSTTISRLRSSLPTSLPVRVEITRLRILSTIKVLAATTLLVNLGLILAQCRSVLSVIWQFKILILGIHHSMTIRKCVEAPPNTNSQTSLEVKL